jgi:hypothetical protein
MSRVRKWLESIVFAGLKPGGQPTQAAPTVPTGTMGRLRARIDRWLSGGPAPSDPLYLTNRTMWQKVRGWLVVGVPLVIVIGGIALVLGNMLAPPVRVPQKELTAAEAGAKFLPSIKDFNVETSRVLEVMEVRIYKNGGVKMTGTVRNLTARVLPSAQISCDLTDAGGTQLGSVSVALQNIPASGTKDFELPIKQDQAAFVLVREIAIK